MPLTMAIDILILYTLVPLLTSSERVHDLLKVIVHDKEDFHSTFQLQQVLSVFGTISTFIVKFTTS